MSTSTRSEPASPTSPATGDAEPGPDPESPEAPEATARPAREVVIELEVSRQRFIAWSVFGIVVGALLIWKLGTVGVWVGWLLVGLGVWRTFQLVQSFVNEPGAIRVAGDAVTLPRGPCAGRPIQTTASAITAVYFLRRSVPWHKTSPVLVVELGARALLYPRDWFANEADQRHVVHALVRKPAD